MAQDIGFFEQLTGGSGDEEAQARAIQEQAMNDPRLGARQYARAQQGGEAIGALLGGLFNKDVRGAQQTVKDANTARTLGISPEELRARREVRRELAKEEYTDNGTHENRIKMAERAAEISLAMGDSAGAARAFAMRDALLQEKTEFNKLKAETSTAETEATDKIIQNAWLDGKPVTGREAIVGGQAGMYITNPAGQLVFQAYGADFNQVDPNRSGVGTPKGIAHQLKINKGVGVINRIHGLASSANTALRKTRRVLATLNDFGDEAQEMMSMSGGVITSIDNLSRNVRSLISQFASGGAAADTSANANEGRTFAGRTGLRKMAEDASNSFSQLIQLPPGIEATSAAAQQHRANVMEMAYMAARLAEPSNRGLSDNDVKNALIRIAGDTSNPQVMMRRFIEMQTDAAHELDYELSLMHGSLGPEVSNEDIDMALVGEGYKDYKKRKNELFDEFGVVVDDTGRARFANIVDADVQPGDKPSTAPAPGTPTTVEEDEALLDDLFGPQGED